MKSIFFCGCCCKSHDINDLGGDLGGKKYCVACYPAAKNRINRARIEARKVKIKELSGNDQKAVNEHQKKLHARSAEIAFQQELARIEREMVSYEY